MALRLVKATPRPLRPAAAPPVYAELHARSAFSLLEGASAPERLAARAVARGLAALAVLDRDDMGGAVRLQVAAEGSGLRIVHGATLTLEGGARLPLLVRDRTGWSNVCRLVSRARLERERGLPETTWATLGQHAEGLVALTGTYEGPVARALAEGGEAAAARELARLRELFGDDLVVEVTRHGLAWEHDQAARLIRLAERHGLVWVPTNDVRYADREDRVAHDVLTCLEHRVTLDEAGTRLLPNDAWHLKGPAEMARMWPDHPEALARTLDVAARCRFDVCKDLNPVLPAYQPGAGEDRGCDDTRLRELVTEGAAERYGERLTDAHRRQLEHELAVIARLSLAGYFLIVHDIVSWARRRGVLVQGRGSAANSAVCYCLGITAIDPIGMDLLFERFLTDNRKDPPDIDIDIAHMEREEVLQYVYARYGRRHAGMVCETITWRGKSAVRDVARVMGFDVEVGARLSAQVDRREAGDAADHLAAGGAAAAGLDPGSARVEALVDVVRRLDRLPRHRSIHVGGFVLTAEPLDHVVPIEAASMEGRTVIQWDKDDLGPVGLVKIDLLGLGILTVIGKCIDLVAQGRGEVVDLAQLPMDDPQVYEVCARADTIGLFQIESRAQMATLPRLRPDRFYDLVVQVAIIRPGPIQGDMVHPYIRRRRGEEPVTYLHPDLEPVLARTLGVPLFQEQGMKVAITMAGFTADQADRLRKIMGFKRAPDHLEGVVKDLWDGMLARGVDEGIAFRILKQLEGFAHYGFPESHAASFALLAYASAWLRHYYAPEYLAAMLNAQPMGFYSPATLITDARRHGVEVRPVDLMASRWECTLEHDVGPPAVRLGLRMVRGLSTAAREALEEALAEGPLSSLDALVFRTRLDDRALIALAQAGAFRTMWPGRRQALWQLLGRLRERRSPLPLRTSDEAPARLMSMTVMEETRADYAFTGTSLTAHPIAFHRAWLDRRGVVPADGLAGLPDRMSVTVAGLVICRQRPESAKGVFFMTLEDEGGMTNIVVMPDLFDRHRVLLATAPALLIRGRLEQQQGVINVIGWHFERLDPLGGLPNYRSHDFH